MKISANIVSTDFIRNHSAREYNPTEWDRNIDRYLKFENVVFYHAAPGDGYSYNRFFVEYTIEEGIRFMKPFTYTSVVSDRGFLEAEVTKHVNGETIADMMNQFKASGFTRTDDWDERLNAIIDSQAVYIEQKEVTLAGTTGAVTNTKKGRAWMAKMSKLAGWVFTQGL